MRLDHKKKLKYAPLKGKTFYNVFTSNPLPDCDSVVFFTNGQCFTKSQAGLEILKTLGGFYKIIGYALGLIPSCILNIGYGFISQNRYALFGKIDSCKLPSQNDQLHFLE